MIEKCLFSYRQTNHDIMTDDLEDLMKGQMADLMYVDPPWGPGMLKYFRTKNGQRVMVDSWRIFLARLREIWERYCKGPYFIKMGHEWVNDVVSIFGTPEIIYPVFYANGKTSALIQGGGHGHEYMLSHKTGRDLVRDAIRYSGAWTVLDPCSGYGMTGHACLDLVLGDPGRHMRVYLNELNPERSARACGRLGKPDNT